MMFTWWILGSSITGFCCNKKDIKRGTPTDSAVKTIMDTGGEKNQEKYSGAFAPAGSTIVIFTPNILFVLLPGIFII